MNVPTLINQYIATEETTYSDELSQLILSNSLTLLQFIQHLGPHVTSEDVSMRTRALSCLANTLAPLQLSKQDVNVMVSFLCEKLASGDATEAVLRGLRSLVLMPGFLPSYNAETVLRALQDGYEPRKNLARARHGAFELLSALGEHTDYVKKLGELFVTTFLHVASGEKDPRNLLSSFALNKHINTHFEVEGHIEDLFDVCFCYFPISFSPPANDPYKITAEQLKTSLRDTIASQSLYAKDAFPNLLEKLTSTNPVVRNDVLKTILLCVKQYRKETLEEYWMTLWNALKFEVLHNDISSFSTTQPILKDHEAIDDTDEFKPLLLVLQIVNVLIDRLGDSADPLVKTIVDELIPTVATMRDKAKQACVVLGVVEGSSIDSFNGVLKRLFEYEVWGRYFNIQKDESKLEPSEKDLGETDVSDYTLNVARQRDLVDCLGYILSGYEALLERLRTHTTPQFLGHFVQSNELLMYKDHLVMFLGHLLMQSSALEKTLKVKAVEQLARMATMSEFLSPNEMRLVLGYMDDLLTSAVRTGNWQKDVVVAAITRGLVDVISVSTAAQDAAQEVVLTSLLRLLDEAHTDGNIDSFTSILDLVGRLCVNPHILETLSIRLLSKSGSSTLQAFQAMVEHLIDWVVGVQARKPFLMNAYVRTFVPRFLDATQSFDDPYVLDICGDLVGVIIRCTDVAAHQTILNDLTARFSKVFESPSKNILIYNKVLASVDRGVEIKKKDTSASIIKLIQTADVFLRIQYLQTLCLLNNKFADMSEDEIVGVSDPEISVWLIKALVMRLDPLGLQLLNDKLAVLFDESPLEEQLMVANSLRVVFADLKVFSNSINGVRVKSPVAHVNNLNVKPLYKQKIFESIAPLLVSHCESNPKKFNLYMHSLAVMIENVSSKILTGSLVSILPMILKGLQVRTSALILSSSLSTLKVVLAENSDILGDHIDVVVVTLLEIATEEFECSSTEIKVLALECLLSVFGKFLSLHSHKKRALMVLRGGLDDRKRRVRKLTADLRQVLYEY